MSVKVKVEGYNNIEYLGRNASSRAKRGLLKAITDVYEKSQTLVPVRTGALQRSGKITELKDGYTITYSKKNKGYDYAPIQHENLEFKHRIGQAKYLEKAFDIKKIKKTVVTEVLKK